MKQEEKLLTVLTVELMKDYLSDVRNDPEYDQLTDQAIIEEYMVCQLNCLLEEKYEFEFDRFIHSCNTVLTLMFRDDSLTKRVTADLIKQFSEIEILRLNNELSNLPAYHIDSLFTLEELHCMFDEIIEMIKYHNDTIQRLENETE